MLEDEDEDEVSCEIGMWRRLLDRLCRCRHGYPIPSRVLRRHHELWLFLSLDLCSLLVNVLARSLRYATYVLMIGRR